MFQKCNYRKGQSTHLLLVVGYDAPHKVGLSLVQGHHQFGQLFLHTEGEGREEREVGGIGGGERGEGEGEKVGGGGEREGGGKGGRERGGKEGRREGGRRKGGREEDKGRRGWEKKEVRGRGGEEKCDQ